MFQHSDHGHEGKNSAANGFFPETLPLLLAFFYIFSIGLCFFIMWYLR